MKNFIILFLTLVAFQTSSLAQCTGCTYTYNGTGSTNFNLNGGQTLCVNSNLNANININGSNAIICVKSGVTFNWHNGNTNGSFTLNNYGNTNLNLSANLPSNTEINNYSGATLNTNTINFNGSNISITNDGTWKLNSNIRFSNNSSITNTGTLNANNKTIEVQSGFTVSSTGSITNINQLKVDGSNASLMNSGSITVTGSGANALLIQNGAYMENTVNSELSVDNGRIKVTASGSKLVNSGDMSSEDFINDEAIVVNNSTGTYYVSNFFENRGPTTNDGEITIDGDFFQSNKGINGQFTNNGYVEIKNDFTVASQGYVSGSGGFKIGGTSQNDGNVSNVDICDQTSSNGGNFDGGSGSNTNTTTCAYNPLPVDLVYFKIVKNSDLFSFEWQTASELNASHFVLQEMNDKAEVIDIFTIECAGTTNEPQFYTSPQFDYNFEGDKFYRLVQYDFDGKYKAYDWKHVEGVQSNNKTFSLYPNPASTHIQLQFNGNAEATKIIMLYDASGQPIHTYTASGNSLKIDIQSFNLKNFAILEVINGSHVERAKIQIK